MTTFSEEGLTIDSCPACLGLWFDREELRRFFPARALVLKVFAQDALPSTQRPPLSPRRCPACEVPMQESPVGGVQVDHCRRCHGIWLDHGELTRVVAGYHEGKRGNLMVLNQLAEGLRAARRRGP